MSQIKCPYNLACALGLYDPFCFESFTLADVGTALRVSVYPNGKLRAER